MLVTKSGFEKLLKDEFPDIVLWQCLNHRLELAVGNALNATSGTNDLQSFHESLYFYIVSHRRTCENLVAVSMICIPASKRIGKVFAIRWVGSSFRAVSAVKHSFPALAQHFQNASENETRQSAEKADFQISANGGLLQRLKPCQKRHKTEMPHCQKPKTYCPYNSYRKPYCFSGRAFHFGSTCRRSNVVPGCTIARR